MINQPLLDFIKQQLQSGLTKEKITSELLANGWNAQDIEEGFKKVLSLEKNKFEFLFKNKIHYKKWIIFFSIIVLSYFVLSKIPFCHENTIRNEVADIEAAHIDESFHSGKIEDFYPVEAVEKYRMPVGICTFPDGGMSKTVDFTISVFEDSQKTKVLSYFDKKTLGLHSLAGSYGGGKGNSAITIFPYSDIEYEIIVSAYGYGEDKSTYLPVYLKVDKSKKSVELIKSTESKYLAKEKALFEDSTGKISDFSKNFYKTVEQYFQESRKVIKAISFSGSVILTLDDGREVYLNGFYSLDKNDETLDYKSMQNFLDKNVLNNYVKVSLPSVIYFTKQGYGLKSKYNLSNISKINNVKIFLSDELLNRKIRAFNYSDAYNFDFTDREVLKQIYSKTKNEFNREYIVKKINALNYSILLDDGKIIYPINLHKLDESLIGKKIKIEPLNEEKFIDFNLSWNSDRYGFYEEKGMDPWKPYGKIFVSNFTIK